MDLADTIDPADIAAAFASAVGHGEAQAGFLERLMADYRRDELPGWDAAALGGLFASLWRFGQEAEGGGFRLERAALADAAGRPLDLLMLAEPDKPFVVDSVMGEVAAQGLEPRAMFHAPVDTPWGRAAVMLVVLGAVGDDRRAALDAGVLATLADVRIAVADFDAMIALMAQVAAELSAAKVKRDPEAAAEDAAFLRWLTADRFVFLGARVYTYPRDEAGDYIREQPAFDPAESLGVLRDPARSVLRRASEPAAVAASTRRYLERSPPVVVAKGNLRSRVHRRAYMDYVGVRRYDEAGRAAGEIRFVGLFTAEAYEEPAHDLPLLRRKVARVLARLGADCGDYSQRRLRHIVETYPRDELFQTEEDDLYRIALGVLHLQDRPRVGLFVRKDPFDRFRSVLLLLPGDHYDSEVQGRAGHILAELFGGRVSAVYPAVADGPLARVHYIIGLDPGHPEPDPAEVEARLVAAIQTWGDRFEAALREGAPPEGGVARVLARWRGAFPPGYRDHNDVADAIADIAAIEAQADRPLAVRAFRRPGDGEARFRFKLYVHGRPAPLSDVLPIFERMGLRAIEETGGKLTPAPSQAGEDAPDGIWVHEYLLDDANSRALALDDLEGPFAETFVAVWAGQADNDGFNRLVLELGVSWRQAALIRALAAWRRQSGLDPGQAVQEAALAANPGVARLILDLFAVRFDPAIDAPIAARREQAAALRTEIEAALQEVASLEADRALRRMAAAVGGMTRTNFYQTEADGAAKTHIAFKFDSGAVADLPLPKPFREIFVAGPRVEGVHLRFGPVARGGLRWSDRREDYRTEVLGLVKTQHVKNAVIVPVGAKGGFFPKQLVRGADPRAEALEAYKVYLRGLLDLTDNLDHEGKVVRPEGLVVHDADDPYLVVAADKGTATFSDTANAVAAERGFWLGDAFASGGSAGYDHKEMGITARGAWEAVKRHFREMGKDVQTEPFTCIGIGDMSGDVFGNGVLRSKATRLVAAFDHRHVFLDPSPDPETSFRERERLFALPTSSWADYDPKLISPGGGVFPRSAKSVPLSPEVRALLDVQDEALTPSDLIRAVLKARVELLYLGGIGCYVKAPTETHAEVMDKANDAVRVDATQLRCQVVGEGANLGFTQGGRIAYARAGGRIDTDAIDNSAGVDTSDHEVNIKILLDRAARAGSMRREDRDALLVAMTDEVAAHVLAHNYAQTLALTLQQATAVEDLDPHAEFVADLVAHGRLDTAVEGLPDPKGFDQLKAQGLGLTRPELAVLTAYGKLELSAALVRGSLPDDPWFETELADYFPDELAPFGAERQAHPLRREIIATVTANTLVDRVGPTFVHRMTTALGCDTAAAVAAFTAARAIFRLDEAWISIHALDLKVPAEAQTRLYLEIALVLRAQAYWLAAKGPRRQALQVGALVEAYRASADALKAAGDDLLSPFEQEAVQARRRGLVAAGAPEDVAAAVAALRALTPTVEVADLARDLGWDAVPAARLFHAAGAAFGFDRLKAAAAVLHRGDAFEQMAVRRLLSELIDDQRALARLIDGEAPKDRATAEAAVAAWTDAHKAVAEPALQTLHAVEGAGDAWTFARLSIAAAALRDLVRQG